MMDSRAAVRVDATQEPPRQRATARPAPPAFDAQTFDRAYFTEHSNYGGRYDWYNPPHKIAGYLRAVRRWRPDGELLDVGCAFGRFLSRAGEHYHVEGMDISAYALGLARRVVPEIPLYQSAIETFAPGKTYDVITCFDVLEHVPDLDLALRRLRALLRPDGVLALAIPVYDTLPGRVFGLIDRDATHVHREGRQFWVARLTANGLRPLAVEGVLRVPVPRFFIHLISPLFRRFSSALFIVCTPAAMPGPH